jgi:hypothetical protein
LVQVTFGGGMFESEARQIALDYVKAKGREAGLDFVLLENQTIERNFGWIFFYTLGVIARRGTFEMPLQATPPSL